VQVAEKMESTFSEKYFAKSSALHILLRRNGPSPGFSRIIPDIVCHMQLFHTAMLSEICASVGGVSVHVKRLHVIVKLLCR